MTFENNFINHSKEYIFLDNQTLLNQRQKTFEKISKNNYDKKNNESLKHITISDLSNFDYFFKPENEDSKVTITDKYNYEIRIANGICKNYEDDNIDPYYRNLSRLLTVMKDDNSSFEHQLNILRPILNSPSKLQLLAAELEVILHIRSNNINEANTKLKKLLERSDISFEQKTRLELIKKIYYSNAK